MGFERQEIGHVSLRKKESVALTSCEHYGARILPAFAGVGELRRTW